MNKQILLLVVLGVVGSQTTLAQVQGEGMCARVTAVERNARGSVDSVCFSATRTHDNWSNQIDCGNKGPGIYDWWYYAGANDPAGETAGKYYISKTPSAVGPVWQRMAADTGATKLVVKGDWCRMIKVAPVPPPPNVWNQADRLANGAIEKMVCRPDTGTGYNGCVDLDWLGWQSRK